MWRLDAKPSSPVLVALERFSALQAMLTEAEKALGAGNPWEIRGKSVGDSKRMMDVW